MNVLPRDKQLDSDAPAKPPRKVPPWLWRLAARIVFYSLLAIIVWFLVGYIERQLVFPGARYNKGYWEQPALAPEDVYF